MSIDPATGITDHALLRYMQRRHGIDVEGFRQLMVAEVGHLVGGPDCTAVFDGFEFKVFGGRIVTVIPRVKHFDQRTRRVMGRREAAK